MSRRSSSRGARASATLALVVLPILAVAGCGQTGQNARGGAQGDLQRAAAYLQGSGATSVTASLLDPDGTLARSMTADGSSPEAVAALLGGSVTITVDPTGAHTLADVQGGQGGQGGAGGMSPTDRLRQANIAVSLRSGGAEVAGVRLVDGTLYVHADLAKVTELADTFGAPGLPALTASVPEPFRPLLADVAAGRWLRLPLGRYAEQLQQLQPAAPGPSVDPQRLGTDLLAAVRPFVKVLATREDGGTRVLDVQVQAKKALQAALGALSPLGTALPGAGRLGTAELAGVGDGTLDGRVTLQGGHLTGLSLDLASAARLSTPAAGRSAAPDLAGSSLQLAVDDAASEVSAPDDVSSVDVDALVQSLVGALGGAFGTAALPS